MFHIQCAVSVVQSSTPVLIVLPILDRNLWTWFVVTSFPTFCEMDNKRKHEVILTHTNVNNDKIKSKKLNIDIASTENAFGTSSFNLPNNQGDLLPAIVLKIVNPELITADVQDAQLFNYYTVDETSKQCSGKSIRSSVITSVNQQDNEYDWTQDKNKIYDIRSKFTTYNNNKYYLNDEVEKTDNFGTNKCIDLFQCSDHEMSTTSSECSDESIGTTITAVSQQDDYNYDWTEHDLEINNTRQKFTISNNMTNVIDYQFDDPSENNTNNEIRITNCFNAMQYHSINNSSQCSDDGKHISSSSSNSVGSTILTSVRQQENECYVYLTEYDEKMNEIRSEVYNIIKQKSTSSEKPFRSILITSADQHLNGYNEEDTQQPSKSSEQVNNPEILICTIIQNNIFQNNESDDDESHPKEDTN
ncbi:uncharacterized protein LOC112600345 [Melanaphis sacchari]|uniref:uncharacterized protein LOC112600345 n=1 Tax=Melanaphis sacchari TaxID=742174 RepID=UPI000DC151AF|nr:uncharacterized protein LOC112600345 [Melanaphis sacchari]